MTDISNLKEGDKGIRYLGGRNGVRIKGIVKAVQRDILFFACEGTEHWSLEDLWKFDRKTGMEEDEYLEWGVKYGRTGSFLKEDNDYE